MRSRYSQINISNHWIKFRWFANTKMLTVQHFRMRHLAFICIHLFINLVDFILPAKKASKNHLFFFLDKIFAIYWTTPTQNLGMFGVRWSVFGGRWSVCTFRISITEICRFKIKNRKKIHIILNLPFLEFNFYIWMMDDGYGLANWRID